jgi:hypothetical protein
MFERIGARDEQGPKGRRLLFERGEAEIAPALQIF